MVFVHGIGIDHKSWQKILDDFSGQTTLTYDLLGRGQTKLTLGRRSFEAFTDQLDDLLGGLEIPEVILVGLSLDGLVAA